MGQAENMMEAAATNARAAFFEFDCVEKQLRELLSRRRDVAHDLIIGKDNQEVYQEMVNFYNKNIMIILGIPEVPATVGNFEHFYPDKFSRMDIMQPMERMIISRESAEIFRKQCEQIPPIDTENMIIPWEPYQS